MLGLQIPKQSQTVNLGWLLLVLGLGLTEATCCLFDRIREPRPAVLMEKQLGWAHNLGGAESLWISKLGETVLARLMESQIWHQVDGSMALWGEGPAKR